MTRRCRIDRPEGRPFQLCMLFALLAPAVEITRYAIVLGFDVLVSCASAPEQHGHFTDDMIMPG